jgi:hypothetical protein
MIREADIDGDGQINYDGALPPCFRPKITHHAVFCSRDSLQSSSRCVCMRFFMSFPWYLVDTSSTDDAFQINILSACVRMSTVQVRYFCISYRVVARSYSTIRSFDLLGGGYVRVIGRNLDEDGLAVYLDVF